jgi:hypothetical protein
MAHRRSAPRRAYPVLLADFAQGVRLLWIGHVAATFPRCDIDAPTLELARCLELADRVRWRADELRAHRRPRRIRATV